MMQTEAEGAPIVLPCPLWDGLLCVHGDAVPPAGRGCQP